MRATAYLSIPVEVWVTFAIEYVAFHAIRTLDTEHPPSSDQERSSRSMPTPSLIAASLLAISLAATAQAATRKCTGRDGKVTYSDVVCPERTQSERGVETGGNTLDASELRERIHKDKAAAEQAAAQERERVAVESRLQQQAQAQAAQAARQDALNAERDALAYANCVREVERQSPTEGLKAELFAACRTAGSSQRQSSMTEAVLRECIQNVERTRVVGNDKARQLATCHGADVKPEPVVLVVPSARVRTPSPVPQLLCTGNQCKDEKGRHYSRQGEALIRDDGKVCRAVNYIVQCP